MSKEQKTEGRSGITTRYTAEEIKQLDWLSARWGCDRANTPRMLLSAYLTSFPDLKDAYNASNSTIEGA